MLIHPFCQWGSECKESLARHSTDSRLLTSAAHCPSMQLSGRDLENNQGRTSRGHSGSVQEGGMNAQWSGGVSPCARVSVPVGRDGRMWGWWVTWTRANATHTCAVHYPGSNPQRGSHKSVLHCTPLVLSRIIRSGTKQMIKLRRSFAACHLFRFRLISKKKKAILKETFQTQILVAPEHRSHLLWWNVESYPSEWPVMLFKNFGSYFTSRCSTWIYWSVIINVSDQLNKKINVKNIFFKGYRQMNYSAAKVALKCNSNSTDMKKNL